MEIMVFNYGVNPLVYIKIMDIMDYGFGGVDFSVFVFLKKKKKKKYRVEASLTLAPIP